MCCDRLVQLLSMSRSFPGFLKKNKRKKTTTKTQKTANQGDDSADGGSQEKNEAQPRAIREGNARRFLCEEGFYARKVSMRRFLRASRLR